MLHDLVLFESFYHLIMHFLYREQLTFGVDTLDHFPVLILFG